MSFTLVQTGGGVSVAERARLFGTQINFQTGPKNSKPPPQQQRPTVNNQSTKPRVVREDQEYRPARSDSVDEDRNYEPPPKSNVAREDRNYQPYRSNLGRYPQPDSS